MFNRKEFQITIARKPKAEGTPRPAANAPAAEQQTPQTPKVDREFRYTVAKYVAVCATAFIAIDTVRQIQFKKAESHIPKTS
jgi:hypothetical protein